MLRMAIEKGMEGYVDFFEKRVGKMSPERKAQLLGTDPRALLAFNSNSSTWPSSESLLPRLKLPCLIYAGEQDFGFAAAKEGAALIPGAPFVGFPGFNHMQCYAESNTVLPVVRKFLTGLKKDAHL